MDHLNVKVIQYVPDKKDFLFTVTIGDTVAFAITPSARMDPGTSMISNVKGRGRLPLLFWLFTFLYG